jgi:hypothetical protein
MACVHDAFFRLPGLDKQLGDHGVANCFFIRVSGGFGALQHINRCVVVRLP